MLRNATVLLAFILAAALSPTVHAAQPLTTFVAYLSGYIDIGPDGSVQAYSLSPSISKDGPLKRALDRRIHSWRFEPVADKGHPVIAHVLVGITLQADTAANGKDLVVSFSDVQFYSSPLADSPDQVSTELHKSPDKLMAALAPPRYPADAMRAEVGARVELVFQVGDDGKVLATEVNKMDLLLPRALEAKAAARYVEAFRQASLSAARAWTFPASYRASCNSKPCLLAIPILYSMPGTFWNGLQSIPEPLVPWATAQTPIVNLDPSGAPASTRQLIDPSQAQGQL